MRQNETKLDRERELKTEEYRGIEEGGGRQRKPKGDKDIQDNKEGDRGRRRETEIDRGRQI